MWALMGTEGLAPPHWRHERKRKKIGIAIVENGGQHCIEMCAHSEQRSHRCTWVADPTLIARKEAAKSHTTVRTEK